MHHGRAQAFPPGGFHATDKGAKQDKQAVMGGLMFEMKRQLFAQALRSVPTYDLQLAIERRLGVRAYRFGPDEGGLFKSDRHGDIEIAGPCCVTINHD